MTDHKVKNQRAPANGQPVPHWLGHWYRCSSEPQPKPAMQPNVDCGKCLAESSQISDPQIMSQIIGYCCLKHLSFGVVCYPAKATWYNVTDFTSWPPGNFLYKARLQITQYQQNQIFKARPKISKYSPPCSHYITVFSNFSTTSEYDPDCYKV